MLWNQYNCRQLSRVYPAGKRIDSSNFDPQLLWNSGVQLAAMNSQTPDRGMWLNTGYVIRCCMHPPRASTCVGDVTSLTPDAIRSCVPCAKVLNPKQC